MQRTQLPFVISKTINEVAFASIDRKRNPDSLGNKTKDVFEGGATNHTQGAFRYRKSTKKNLTAYIFVESSREK